MIIPSDLISGMLHLIVIFVSFPALQRVGIEVTVTDLRSGVISVFRCFFVSTDFFLLNFMVAYTDRPYSSLIEC